MRICVVLKKFVGDKYVQLMIKNVKDVHEFKDYIKIVYYIDEGMKSKNIISSYTIPKWEIVSLHIYEGVEGGDGE